MNDERLIENHELVGRALNNQLRKVLAGFVGQILSTYYRADWWKRGVLEILGADQRRDLPREGNYSIFTDAMDIQLCSTVIIRNWQELFKSRVSRQQKAWIDELTAIRNDWAHTNLEKFTDSYVERALDTMMRFCEHLDDDVAEKLRAELQKFQALHSDASEIDDGDLQFFQIEGDQPIWCEVIQPNHDVQEGSYRISEFAADLAQVAAGESKLPEYRDATEFFRRTYLTDGMRRLMLEAIGRLVNGNGEPVIEVKTSFGGGKTHSMMALFHLFGRKYNPLTVDDAVKNLFLEAHIKELPKDIYTAVAVGTALNTERPTDIPELDGVQSHTLMGEIFSQLARAAARFDLYQKHIQLNDERGSSPGVKDLRAFLDGCGGCLILIDELVLYGKKLYNGANLEGGNFDQFIVFLQELSEAVRTSSRSILVASLPQSEIEIGIGDGGREVLRTIEHHFGRLQAVWSPVEAHESFEIVRRRLFQPCRLEKARDEICAAFASMYKRGKQTFPLATREARYINRMKACYPIHPQLFDLLYEKWATIETFQKTRGVLRFMAEIVHRLWRYHDRHSMIMPGSIPLAESKVRNELTRYLPSNWSAIIDNEIDGGNSEPYRLEKSERQQQLQVARRLTRTIFLGSAPTARGQNVRGLDEREIMLGVLMPNERDDQTTTKFKDMLGKLKTKLTYLYSNDTHCWFDSRPTLRKVAEAREQNIGDDDVRYEIIDWIEREMKIGALFNAKHITTEPSKVPDTECVRLVILPPNVPFERRSNEPSPTFLATEKIFRWVSKDKERLNKNMLLFLAGDKTGLESLKKLVRRLMAWTQLSDEREQLNFDRKQIEEIESNIAELNKTVRFQLSTSYNHLIEPTAPADNMKEIDWQEHKLNCMERPNMEVIADRLRSADMILWTISPLHLSTELEKYIFKSAAHISLNDLWEYMTRYIYAPRLFDRRVLLDAVRIGVREGFFGLAEDFDEATGEYIGLVMNEPITIESLDQLLVRRGAAEAQLHIDEPIIEEDTTEEPLPTVEPEIEEEPLPTRFSAVFGLNAERPSREIDRIAREIVDILTSLERAELSVELVIKSHAPDGIPEPEAEALKQNCQQLKAKSFRLEL